MKGSGVRRAAYRVLAFAIAVVALCFPSRGWAREGGACDGPAACCPAKVASDIPGHVEVTVGVTLVGLYNINEKAGTWDADYYLHEEWSPTPDFTPQTEIVNEVSRSGQQFDETELRKGRCVRSRRIHSTLHSAYDLHTFPFDSQRLTLVLSDAEFTSREASYKEQPTGTTIDVGAKEQLASWKLMGGLSYTHAARVFDGDDDAPLYDYATFSLPVRRYVSFHLTKFFLPLFIIVAVALSPLWIDPDDLSSRASVGVTCLLAAIAFQFAEAGTLPEVAYLTLADRVYVTCYVALALALLVSVYANVQARAGRRERSLRVDRRARRLLPASLVVALVASVARSLVLVHA